MMQSSHGFLLELFAVKMRTSPLAEKRIGISLPCKFMSRKKGRNRNESSQNTGS
jgi:hypothetical protein